MLLKSRILAKNNMNLKELGLFGKDYSEVKKQFSKIVYCVRYVQFLSEIAGADLKESSYLASLLQRKDWLGNQIYKILNKKMS